MTFCFGLWMSSGGFLTCGAICSPTSSTMSHLQLSRCTVVDEDHSSENTWKQAVLICRERTCLSKKGVQSESHLGVRATLVRTLLSRTSTTHLSRNSNYSEVEIYLYNA